MWWGRRWSIMRVLEGDVTIMCVVDVAIQLSDVTEFGHRKIAEVD